MATLPNLSVESFISSGKYTGRCLPNGAKEMVEDFISGFSGTGFKIRKVDGQWIIEADNAVFRGTLTVFELLIQKIRAVKGALCITQASGKIETALLKDGFWHITIEDEMSFVAGDFIRCQSWKDNGLKGYWVEISEVRKIWGKDTILIAASEFTGGIIYDEEGMETIDPALNAMTTPAIADEIIQFGNKTLKNRQSAIYLHADEGGQPAIDVLFGINSKSFSGCTKIRLGGDIPGEGGLKGFYCENGMIKGVDPSGHVVYKIRPDGSAMFGDGSAEFREDKSGYIAGGAISWHYDKEKKKFITNMNDVVLDWNNLSQETKEELKGGKGDPGEDGVVYELRPSVSFIPIDQEGKAKVEFIDITLYRTVGSGVPEPYPLDCSIFYTVYQGVGSASTSSPKNNVRIQTYTGESTGENPIDKAIVTANINTTNGQKKVASITLESLKDGFSSDWLRDWDKNKTSIDGESVVSPKMFSGKRNADGTLTGVFSGRECIRIDGVAHTGIFAVVNSVIIFSLDPENGLYKFKGRVEADEGYFKGRIEADEGYFKGRIEADEGYFKGKIEADEGYFKGKIEADEGYIKNVNVAVGGDDESKLEISATEKAIILKNSKGVELGKWSFDDDSWPVLKMYYLGENGETMVSSALSTHTLSLTDNTDPDIANYKRVFITPTEISMYGNKKSILDFSHENGKLNMVLGVPVKPYLNGAWNTSANIKSGQCFYATREDMMNGNLPSDAYILCAKP